MNVFDEHRLNKVLGYCFRNKNLLLQALTHRSFEGALNNERLEFLGDSVLNFVIAEAVFRKFPEASEGELTRLRAALVKGETLAIMGKKMGLGEVLRLGLGELNTGGFRRSSTLEDALEALIGAIFLDSDLETTKNLLLHWFSEHLKLINPGTVVRDAKSRLQEWLQAKNLPLPVYEILQERGPEHDKIFYVRCSINVLNLSAEGQGISKKLAEQMAAEALVQQLDV